LLNLTILTLTKARKVFPVLQIIPRPVHAALDYVYGVKALAAPKLLGFEDDDKARLVATIAGVGAIVSGLTTRHEGGLVKLVPFNTHLKLDLGAAILTAASPWLLGFADNARARNTILGLAALEAAVVFLSQPDPE
jgi:SPW repeat